MQVAVLASGSKGNATFVEMDGIRILIDAGISARRIKQAQRHHEVYQRLLRPPAQAESYQ